MYWALNRVRHRHLLAGLVLEEVDRVRRMVPEQMVGP